MKQTLFFLFIAFFSFNNCKADQLQIITKEQAIRAVELLKKQQKIVIWCSCCETGIGSEPKKVAVRNVYYKIVDLSSADAENYVVVIQGVNLFDKTAIDEEIDLAYTHIGKNGIAITVAESLNFPFKKCNEDNDWEELSEPVFAVQPK